MGRLKYDPQEIIRALNDTRGMIYLAAERMGCEADTIYNYAKRFPAVAAAIQRHRERTTDIAELKLYQAITNGEPWAIQFYLKTQGRGRGYQDSLKVDMRMEIYRVAARVGENFGMTAEEVIAEAEAYLREEGH
jgi:hypothetical protein